MDSSSLKLGNELKQENNAWNKSYRVRLTSSSLLQGIKGKAKTNIGEIARNLVASFATTT